MMDLVTLFGGGYFVEKCGGKELLVRVFGPTADYLGEKLAATTKDILESAAKKISFHRVPEENRVSPAIIHQMAYDWIYDDEQIFSEYYGGILTASKRGQNDIGKAIGQTITRLPAYALRLHFIIYNAIKNTFLGKSINLGKSYDCRLCCIYIKKTDLDLAMGFTDEDVDHHQLIYGTCLNALAREELIRHGFYLGKAKEFNTMFKMSERGLIVGPSYSGASLLSWAAGFGLLRPSAFFSYDLEFSKNTLPLLEVIPIPPATKIPRKIVRHSDSNENQRREELHKYILED